MQETRCSHCASAARSSFASKRSALKRRRASSADSPFNSMNRECIAGVNISGTQIVTSFKAAIWSGSFRPLDKCQTTTLPNGMRRCVKRGASVGSSLITRTTRVLGVSRKVSMPGRLPRFHLHNDKDGQDRSVLKPEIENCRAVMNKCNISECTYSS